MKTLHQSQRAARPAIAFFCIAIFALPAFARHKSEAWARVQFSRASTLEEALNGRPVADRSRREYQRAIDAYREVYFGAPTSSKAEPSVVASAELMVEMGRRFEDPKILNQAIAQYQFLRREYPGSKYRIEALFTIGEIYKDDLDNPAKARATFEDFVKRYPRSHLVAEARKALAEPVQEEAAKTKTADVHADASADIASYDGPADSADAGNKISRVTGIRHWSTPDYTRVAIDLEQDVKFDSQRISHPERIFFDLDNTRLASTLVGKSFDVDDGLLRKIRVAQYKPGRTRIVLEVGETSDYHAFLLTNPPRLMIDIHGNSEAKLHELKDAGTNKENAGVRASEAAHPANISTPVELADAQDDENSPDSGASQDHVVANSSSHIKTVITASGVKKTIVDADNDEAQPLREVPAKPMAKEKNERNDENHDADDLVASLDTPDASAAGTDGSAPSASPADRSEQTTTTSDSSRAMSHSKVRGLHSKNKTSGDLDMHEAQPRADGDRSLIRALGLKIGKIVIDPGHGGHDTGTIGPGGLEEKDVVLDVSRRLGKLLESKLGAEVVYTRHDDTFIPLETRTAIANQEQADLFVSIHANSSRDPDARGVETYYLNFTSSPDALEVAARENAVSEKTVYQLQDLVKKIALREKIEESQEFADDVESSLHAGLAAKNPGLRDRGVKKAPFIVLIGANMPSILAEISFVSNPGDEKRLRSPEYRQRIAESLYRGIAKYVSGLSGVKVASRMEKSSAQ